MESIIRENKMENNDRVNLWDLLTNSAAIHPVEYKRKRIEGMVVALDHAAARPGQEFSIEVDQKGWIIRVFSHYYDDWEIKIALNIDGTVEVSNNASNNASNNRKGGSIIQKLMRKRP